MNYELNVLTKIVNSSDAEVEWRELAESCERENIFVVHGEVFKFIMEYRLNYGKVPDLATVQGKFPDVIFPASPEPFKFYIDEVKQTYVYSKLAELNDSLVKNLREKTPIEAYQGLVTSLATIKPMSKLATDFNLVATLPERLVHYEERRKLGLVNGIPCGWIRIDQETTGWHKGELTFVLGRMGSFKTWVLIAWVCHAWLSNFSVLIFSKEMGVRQLARRIDTLLTAVRFKDVKTGLISDPEFDRFKNTLVSTFQNRPPFIVVDSSGSGDYNVQFIQSKIQQHRPDVVFIDGVYMLQGVGKSDWERQTSITRDLKQVCLTENVPIIGSTQAGRGAAGKKTKIGTQHAAYSDSYGQDADNMIALNRIWDKILDKYSNRILVDLIKVRDAENVRLEITVDLNIMKIFETANQFGPGANSAEVDYDEDVVYGEDEFDEDLII